MERLVQESVRVCQEAAARRGARWAWRSGPAGKYQRNRRWPLELLTLVLLVVPQAAHQARSRTFAWAGATDTTEPADRGSWNTVGVLRPSRTALFPSMSGMAISLSSDVLMHSALRDFFFLPAATS